MELKIPKNSRVKLQITPSQSKYRFKIPTHRFGSDKYRFRTPTYRVGTLTYQFGSGIYSDSRDSEGFLV